MAEAATLREAETADAGALDDDADARARARIETRPSFMSERSFPSGLFGVKPDGSRRATIRFVAHGRARDESRTMKQAALRIPANATIDRETSTITPLVQLVPANDTRGGHLCQ
jgi:hypothetical protein